MTEVYVKENQVIYHEMIVHPALFMHSHPRHIAVLSDSPLFILKEVLKHKELTEIGMITSEKIDFDNDPRIKYISTKTKNEPFLVDSQLWDILIVAARSSVENYAIYFNMLNTDGILVQESESPFQLDILKMTQHSLQKAGFNDVRLLNFPQPNFSGGWRSVFVAKKRGMIRKIREKDIFNKAFTTHYYNLDVHKAAMALPEFMRDELGF